MSRSPGKPLIRTSALHRTRPPIRGLITRTLLSRNIKSMGKDTANMERHLSGGHHVQSAVRIQIRAGAERLHHGLLICLCVIHTVNHIVAGCENRFNIPILCHFMGTEISLVVRTHPGRGFFQFSSGCTRIGLSFAFRKSSTGSRTSYLDFDKLHRLLHSFLACSSHNGSRIADKTAFSDPESACHTGSAPDKSAPPS